MPKIEAFCSKFKIHFHDSPYLEEFVGKTYQTSSIKLYLMAIKFYSTCSNDVKQNNSQTGLFRMFKRLLSKFGQNVAEEEIDECLSISKNDFCKIPLFVAKIDRKIGNIHQIIQHLYNIFQNNLRKENEKDLLPYVSHFLKRICEYANLKRDVQIIDFAINTAKIVSTETHTSLYKMWNIRFSIHYDLEEYNQALDDCKQLIKVSLL